MAQTDFNLQTRYQKLAKIGEGSCGVVFKCLDRENKRVVAVKKIRFSYEGDEAGAQDEHCSSSSRAAFGIPSFALREVALLTALRGHPHIVQLNDVFLEGSTRIFIICEFLELDLRRKMAQGGQLHPQRTKLYTWQLLLAVAHCHAREISHRDIKPENILVDPKADILKLCDFSLARHVASAYDVETRRVASLWYRSPEILLGGKTCGFALDTWSLGCVLGEMLGHGPVFPGSSEIETLFLQFRKLGTPTERSWPGVLSLEHWSPDFPRFTKPPSGFLRIDEGAVSQLLDAMLQCNPDSRPAVEVLQLHTYFLDLDRTLLHVHSGSSSRTSGANRTETYAQDLRGRTLKKPHCEGDALCLQHHQLRVRGW